MIDNSLAQRVDSTTYPSNHAPVIPSGRYHKGDIWGWILGIIVVLFGAYVGAQWYFSDRVPGGAVAAGVEIGGLSRDAAVTALEAELGPLSHQPIPLQAGGAATTIDPVAAGVTFSAAQTVEQLTDFSLLPSRLLTHLRSDYGEVPLVIDIAQPRFNAAAGRAAHALAQEPINGHVIFTDGIAATTAARAGQTIENDAIVNAVTSRWLHQTGAIEVEATSVQPQITQAATDAAFSLARQIAGGPITAEIDGQTLSIPAEEVADATRFHAVGGELVPIFDAELLTKAVLERGNHILRDPENAHFEFVPDTASPTGTRPEIVGGQDGTTVDADTVRDAIQEAALSGTRVAQIEVTYVPPELSASDLENLGVTEVVSSFSTLLTANTVRTNNLRRGGELITGVLLLPGETFSLTDSISPINEENGFGNAGAIVAGNFTEGMGGGLSQLATTAYNAGFFAGFENIESRPHSLFINRYPAGREATLVLGSLDMRFRNNTPHGALIQSWVANNRIHVAIWSTPYFRVETQMSERTEIVDPIFEERSGPECVPQSPGPAGFLISNSRQVFRLDNNQEVINETNRWRYRPTNGIRCVG